MKRLTKSLIILSLVALLLGACVAVPASPPAPTAETATAPSVPAVDWQTYTDAEVGFSLQMPATWSSETLPDQNDGAIHGTAFTGPEGGVEVYWGVGFGGACPTGTVPVQLAVGELPACQATNADGTEVWSQIGYEVSGGNSFSVRAYTSNAEPASHDLVLEVLATLTFMPPAEPEAQAAIANPASQNCVDQGGTLSIEERGDGGQLGVCTFEDNMQCEEWALMRGECPVGGVKVTGYVTPAATYCAITGGEYAVTGNSGAEDEQGTCTFKDGSQCDAWDYYNGACTPGAEPVAATATSPAAEARVPLEDAVASMDPQDVWQNFYDLTQIPRPSHHEEQVRDFLVQFGQGLGLETIVDGVGNVLIRKPAAAGMENRHGVILQAHMDMVPQKTPESDHDFLTDPIDAYVEGEWVMADGTTLGADDGSGVAIAMAILGSDTLALGPIEALFTVNEEDGMDGANGLEPGVLQGDTLINLDSEEVGVFTIGSAGGEYLNVQAPYAEAPLPSDVTAYTMTVSGLQGGHSGVDINLGLGHATKLLVRLLDQVAADQGVRVAQLSGGTAANAIPREADALVVVPAAQVDAFLQAVQAFEATVQSELAVTEPDLTVQATPTELPEVVMDEAAQKTLIAALYGSPQGVLRMSDTVPDLVETSVNMGIVNAADGQLAVTWLSRSSVDSEVVDVRRMLSSVWELAGIEPVPSGTYSGWAPNPDSPILLLMEDVYKNMYGEDPEVSAIHAGLECGTIAAKYPGMDAISIGPTLENVHTPNERMEIASVKKLNDFLIETLKEIPEKE